MRDKESIKKTYRFINPNVDEQWLEDYATNMAAKYETIKDGDNVIHLEYFSAIIDNEDIKNIEELISKADLELSRFDKMGVPQASLEEFTLQIALCLRDPLVETVLVGIGTNLIWDAIKKSTLLLWKQVVKRKALLGAHKLNFGLYIHLKNHTSIKLKFNSEFDEKTTLEAMDKVLELVKEKQNAPSIDMMNDFYIFNNNIKKWEEINIREEFKRMHEEQSKKKKMS